MPVYCLCNCSLSARNGTCIGANIKNVLSIFTFDVRALYFTSGRQRLDEEDLRAEQDVDHRRLTRWTASELIFQKFVRPEGKPPRHLRCALRATCMTQQLFPLSARRQAPSLVAILPRLLRQTVLKRHRLTNSALPFDGLGGGFVGRRAAHDALLAKAVSRGRRDRRSTRTPESVLLRAGDQAREVATCC